MLRSADGGRSWTSAGLADRNIRAIQAEPDGRVLAVVAGWSGGLFETRNSGASWDRRGPSKYGQAVVADPEHSLYFLGTRGGSILRSDPAGWKGVGRGLGMTNVHALLVSETDCSSWERRTGSTFPGIKVTPGSGPLPDPVRERCARSRSRPRERSSPAPTGESSARPTAG